MTTKSCRIHYRKLSRVAGNFPSTSLSDRIAASLAAIGPSGKPIGEQVQDRVTGIPQQPEARRVLNNSFVDADHVFGTICAYSPGQMQALLRKTGSDSPEPLIDLLKAFDIAETAAPDGHEYLHAISYWLAIGDHFYQIQHAALQVKAMEEYLTWLLRDQSKTINQNEFVELQSVFDRSQIGDDDLKQLEIGGLIPETATVIDEVSAAADEIEERRSIVDSLSATFAKGIKILRELVGDIAANQIVQNMPPEAALDVRVNIGYRSKRRRLSRVFMADIATSLRNIPDGEIRAIGRNGEVRGDDARLSQLMSVQRISDTSSLLDLGHARDQMLEVHRRFLHDGKI